jgi:hypothetical protein
MLQRSLQQMEEEESKINNIQQQLKQQVINTIQQQLEQQVFIYCCIDITL